MPNYSISISSDDNMLITNEAGKNGMTTEQYLKKILHEYAEKLKDRKP